MLLLGTAVATDMGEQGKQLHREGQHLPPMWSVREGADGHKQLFARSRGADGETARGGRLRRPKRWAAVIVRGVYERVPVRESVGHERGHAQNVRECYALRVQICTKVRKCSGGTQRDRHLHCHIRPRSSPAQTHCGLHDAAFVRLPAIHPAELHPPSRPAATRRERDTAAA